VTYGPSRATGSVGAAYAAGNMVEGLRRGRLGVDAIALLALLGALAVGEYLAGVIRFDPVRTEYSLLGQSQRWTLRSRVTDQHRQGWPGPYREEAAVDDL
jgi:hypothetical protein